MIVGVYVVLTPQSRRTVSYMLSRKLLCDKARLLDYLVVMG